MLEQMPKYAKFLKEILTHKRKLKEYETVKLAEECNMILYKKLLQKLKDPESFKIPCTIGEFKFKALCDLGASVNLMPLSIFRQLGLGECKPTTISLQLVNKTIKYPRGVVEDVLVKVDKFLLPADFIVLDMEEDKDILIILGRPFLAMGRASIDLQEGTLPLRVQDEQVTFQVYEALRFTSQPDENKLKEPPNACSTQTCSSTVNKEKFFAGANYLENSSSCLHKERPNFEKFGRIVYGPLPIICEPP